MEKYEQAKKDLQEQQKFSIKNFPQWLRINLSDSQRFVLLCSLAGILCGLAAVLFHLAIYNLFHTVYTFAKPEVADNAQWSTREWKQFALVLILSPTLGGLLVGILLHKFAPSAEGSGIPQTKLDYYRQFGVMRLREAFARFVLGTLFIGMGNSLGREGPTVHMCAAISSKIGQWFGLARARVQAMVPVGTAAGLAAAFNAPISAIMFVFEELLDDFSTRALGGMVVAVVIAAAIERSIIGEHPILPIDLPQMQTDWWMLVCIPIGFAAAWLSTLFVRTLLKVRASTRNYQKIPEWLKPAIGGFITGLIGTGIYALTSEHGVFSIGYDSLSSSIHQQAILSVFVLLLIGKFIATIINYAAGGSGGLFSPVLFFGGTLGSIFGILLASIADIPDTMALNDLIGACALLGMGAFFAACIRCPITSLFIIYEMTGIYSLILPLMMGNMLAYSLSRRWLPIPVYDALLQQDGINLRKLPSYQGKQDYHMLPVSVVTTHDTITVDANDTPEQALSKLNRNKHHGYPALDQGNKLVGCITHHELEEAKEHGQKDPIGKQIADHPLVTVTPEQSIRDVANILVMKDVMQAPVVSKSDNSRLIGIVTLHDIARQQNATEDILGR